jgi:hypothetical protein
MMPFGGALGGQNIENFLYYDHKTEVCRQTPTDSMLLSALSTYKKPD